MVKIYKTSAYVLIAVVVFLFSASTVSHAQVEGISNKRITDARMSNAGILHVLAADGSVTQYRNNTLHRHFAEEDLKITHQADGILVGERMFGVFDRTSNGFTVSLYEQIEGGDYGKKLLFTQEDYAVASNNLTLRLVDNDNKLFVLHGDTRSNTSQLRIYDVSSIEAQLLFEDTFHGGVTDVVFNAENNTAYAGVADPDGVRVYNTDTGALNAEYQLQAAPRKLEYNSALQRVYATHSFEDIVSVVSVLNGNVRTVVVGSNPRHLHSDTDTGVVYVGNNGDGSVSVIQPDLTVATFGVSSPAYTATSPIYVFYSDVDDRLYVLNASTRELISYAAGNLAGKPTLKEAIQIHPWKVRTDSNPAVVVGLTARNVALLGNGMTSVPALADIADDNALFSGPHSVIANEIQDQLFIANKARGDVVVIDTTGIKDADGSPVVSQVLETGVNPQVITLNETTQKLYVIDSVESTVSVIDTSTLAILSTISLPENSNPRSTKFNEETNTLYVSLLSADGVAVIDGSTDTLQDVIDLKDIVNFPLLLQTNNDRNVLYVADYGGDSVYEIDMATNEVLRSVAVGAKPLWLRYSDEYGALVVTVEGENKIAVVDPETLTLTQEFQLDAMPYRILDHNGYLYVVHRDESLVTVLTGSAGDINIAFEEPIEFFGEMDLTYNMIRRGDISGKFYITDSDTNTVLVVRPNFESDGRVSFEIDTAIFEDGTTLDTSPGLLDFKDLFDDKKTNPYMLFIGAALLVVLVLLLIYLRHISRKKSAVSAPNIDQTPTV